MQYPFSREYPSGGMPGEFFPNINIILFFVKNSICGKFFCTLFSNYDLSAIFGFYGVSRNFRPVHRMSYMCVDGERVL